MTEVRRSSKGLLGPRQPDPRSYDERQAPKEQRPAPRIFYEDSAVTLWHGDCRDVLPMLDRVDHVITDPPYSEHVHRKQWSAHALTKGRARKTGPGAHKELGFEALTGSMREGIAAYCAGVPRWVLVFSDIEGCGLWRSALEQVGLEYVRTGIWHKVDAAPQFTGDRPGSGAEAITMCHPFGRKRWNGGGRKAVFEHCINNDGRLERLHPTPKPQSLMDELVSLFTDPGDTILDPFAGSGTTGVAAKRLGRKCILIERELKYVEIAARRLSQGALDLYDVSRPISHERDAACALPLSSPED